ncbi:MAG: hypothetical protein ACAH95_03020 [Fimbriimonas sp.]
MRKRWPSYIACVVPIAVLGAAFYVTKPLPEPPNIPRNSPSKSRHSLRFAGDRGARDIRANPQRTTIEELLAVKRPEGVDGGETHRRHEPFETNLWMVEAKVIESVVRADGDFYLVIESNSGARTVAEIPDPKHLQDSHYRKEITAARASVLKMLNPTAQPKPCSLLATITGIGFFGQQGKAGNGARLNPVIDIRWID